MKRKGKAKSTAIEGEPDGSEKVIVERLNQEQVVTFGRNQDAAENESIDGGAVPVDLPNNCCCTEQ